MPAPIDPARKARFRAALKDGFTLAEAARQAGVSYAWAKSYGKNIKADNGDGWRALRQDEEAPGPIPLDELNPDAARALEDITYFARRYFGALLMPWQEQAAAYIREALETDDKEHAVMNMPPGSGKSTFFTLIVPAWLTCRNRAIRGLIVSNTQRNAENYLVNLRRALDQPTPIKASDNDIRLGIAVDAEASLVMDYGLFKTPGESGERWTAKAFQVMQHPGRPVSEKESTWQAFGKGGAFLGNRVDIIIPDDVYDRSMVKTSEAREDFTTWYDKHVETRLEPNGLLLLVGQRQDSGDIYRHCLDKVVLIDEDGDDIEDASQAQKKYRHLIFKAHYDELCTGDHKDVQPYPAGCLLYPGRIKWRDIRSLTPDVYAVEYQQEDLAPGSTLVDPLWVTGGRDPESHVEYFGCLDKERDEWQVPAGLTGDTLVVATADPSPTNFWSVQCLATGTSVATRRGEVPIENVRLDDSVWTRKGWRPVQHVTMMGRKPTIILNLSNGRSLTLTADHRVSTPSGWVEAGSLKPGSVVTQGLPCAFSTMPLSADHAEVVSGVLVSSGAVSSSHLGSDVGSAQHVDPTGDRFKMVWIDAATVPAQVIEFQARGYLPSEVFVGQSVGEAFASSASDPAVSIFVPASGPLPASGRDAVGPGDEVRFINDAASGSGDGSVSTDHADGGRVVSDGVSTSATMHVVSITDGPFTETWDIGVYGVHEFSAEGVIVHNCWVLHPATQQRFLLAHVRKKMAAPELLDWNINEARYTGIMDEWQARSKEIGYPIEYWIVEDNAAQKFLLQYDYAQKWKALRGVQIVRHNTNWSNKSDSKLGIEAIGPLWAQGKVRLPYSPSGNGRLGSLALINEVTKWPQGRTDDAVMAHWFAEWNFPRLYVPSANRRVVMSRPTWLNPVRSAV